MNQPHKSDAAPDTVTFDRLLMQALDPDDSSPETLLWQMRLIRQILEDTEDFYQEADLTAIFQKIGVTEHCLNRALILMVVAGIVLMFVDDNDDSSDDAERLYYRSANAEHTDDHGF